MKRRGRRGTKAAPDKTCTKCGETKQLAEFPADKTRRDGKFPWCRPCHVQAQMRYKRVKYVGPEGPRRCRMCDQSIEGAHSNRVYCSGTCKDRAKRVEIYGLTPEEYRTMMDSYGGRCPICKRRIKRWAIDHNHDTGETTGAVCTRCNISLLAYTYHDAEIAQRLTDYLRDPPVRRLFGEKRYTGPPTISQLDKRWAWANQNKEKN